MLAGVTLIAAIALAGLGSGAEHVPVGAAGDGDQGAPGTRDYDDAESRVAIRVQGGWVFPTEVNRAGVPYEASTAFHLHAAVDVAAVYRLLDGVAVEVAAGLIRFDDAVSSVWMAYPNDWAGVTLTTVPLTFGLRAGAGDLRGPTWMGVTAGAGVYLSTLSETFRNDDNAVGILGTESERAVALGGYLGVAFAQRVGERTQLGLEVRYVRTRTAFEHVDLSLDGPQILAGVNHRFR